MIITILIWGSIIKKREKWLSLVLACIMSLCIAAGCASNDGQTEGEQEQEQGTGQETEKEQTTEEEPYILPDIGLPNYIPVLAEWQEIASDGGYFVTVDKTVFSGTVTPEAFAPIAVKRVVLVEGCNIEETCSNDGKFLLLDIYAIETEEKGKDVLSAIQSLEFVDFAWENTYDYRAVHYSAEPKEIINVSEYFRQYFSGRFFLSIDEAFEGRLFTYLDFPFRCKYSVEWYSYEEFKQGAADLTHQKFIVHVWETDEQSMMQYQRVLSDLAFVQMCDPEPWILGFIGYPSE